MRAAAVLVLELLFTLMGAGIIALLLALLRYELEPLEKILLQEENEKWISQLTWTI